jgi:hypothetical protein
MLKEKKQNWKIIQKQLELAMQKNPLYKFKSKESQDLQLIPTKKRERISQVIKQKNLYLILHQLKKNNEAINQTYT